MSVENFDQLGGAIAFLGEDTPELLARFNRLYEPIPWSGCWIWLGAPTSEGYGVIRVGNKKQDYAHRVSYNLFVGPIPQGLEIDHKCRIRCCVNPAHLEAVTHRENARRGDAGKAAAMAKAAITHCPRGHPYDDANTYLLQGRRRQCRECGRARARRWKLNAKLLSEGKPATAGVGIGLVSQG